MNDKQTYCPRPPLTDAERKQVSESVMEIMNTMRETNNAKRIAQLEHELAPTPPVTVTAGG
jgi:hypothetical protein